MEQGINEACLGRAKSKRQIRKPISRKISLKPTNSLLRNFTPLKLKISVQYI
jgi:hypothetical protein